MLTTNQQKLYEVMINEVIPEFHDEDKAELRQAADQWRFPFWDWATKKPQEKGPKNYDVPLMVKTEHVEVRTPTGHTQIKNPFWSFRMKDGVPMGDPSLKPDVVTREPVRPSMSSTVDCSPLT